ncbi:MAG: hypothetical protein LUI08_00815 [Prevotella sp.]|nr:hypothetical protein [Prevotella sp.]
MGSSRAYRHYAPDVLEDSLNLSVYNCGLSANGIIGSYGLYEMVKARYNPDVLVYDIFTPDLTVSDNHTYLGNLRYFYGNKAVDSIFWSVDKTERVKMLSRMYRFNSDFLETIREYVHPSTFFKKGFVMTDKEMTSEPMPLEEKDSFDYDSLKLYYLERLINECEGKTRLIFIVSPLYENPDDKILEPVKTLCKEYDIPLLNHYTDTAFIHYRDFFYDRVHLNARGATEYSKVVAGEIKGILSGKAKGATKN